jgi:hypothetical protein
MCNFKNMVWVDLRVWYNSSFCYYSQCLKNHICENYLLKLKKIFFSYISPKIRFASTLKLLKIINANFFINFLARNFSTNTNFTKRITLNFLKKLISPNSFGLSRVEFLTLDLKRKTALNFLYIKTKINKSIYFTK